MELLGYQKKRTGCKKYKYTGEKYHYLNENKLEVGRIYYIKNNPWGTPCIYNEIDEPIYVLSDTILNNNFEEIIEEN